MVAISIISGKAATLGLLWPEKSVFLRAWFEFNNLGLSIGINLTFYISVAKGLKLKVRKFWGLVPTYVETAGEKLIGEPFLSPCWIGLILIASLHKKWSFPLRIPSVNVTKCAGTILQEPAHHWLLIMPKWLKNYLFEGTLLICFHLVHFEILPVRHW